MDDKVVTLAIQGGGANGAYVWGVLDRLLADDRLHIEGISGTSSGAINGALVAQGLNEGGPERAREKLETFWRRISEECRPQRRFWLRAMRALWYSSRRGLSTRCFHDLMNGLMQPYQFDPATMDPLRSVIVETVDFEGLRRDDSVKLFVNATNAKTNKIRVFSGAELSADAVCASSCLPYLFEPVQIAGESYWDGAFLGNPAIYPLIYECEASDIVLVQSAPMQVEELPTCASELLGRISDVSFTSALIREMRSIEFVSKLIDEGRIEEDARLRRVRLHTVDPASLGTPATGSSKFDADWNALRRLRDAGSVTCDAWLRENFDALGSRPTLDLRAAFV